MVPRPGAGGAGLPTPPRIRHVPFGGGELEPAACRRSRETAGVRCAPGELRPAAPSPHAREHDVVDVAPCKRSPGGCGEAVPRGERPGQGPSDANIRVGLGSFPTGGPLARVDHGRRGRRSHTGGGRTPHCSSPRFSDSAAQAPGHER